MALGRNEDTSKRSFKGVHHLSSKLRKAVDHCKILDGVQFNMEKEANLAVIYDKKDRIYKKLEKERVQWLEAF